MSSLLQPDLYLGAALLLVTWRLVSNNRPPRKLTCTAATMNRHAASAGTMRKPWPPSCRLAQTHGSTPDIRPNIPPPEQTEPRSSEQAPSEPAH
jgi:hypothetical protein